MLGMKSYSLMIGARNVRGTFARRDERILQGITARHFPEGFAILDAKGGWYDPAERSFKREDARQILVCTAQSVRIPAWCRELGKALKQKEVLIVEVGAARRFRIKATASL
jgi:hypothetical protein